MSNNEKSIEQEIQDKGLNAPRLTPDHIDSVISGETYTNLPDGRTVICQLTLQNGYTIDGKSACVSKENFNQEIGNKIARQNAREKIWELEGYLLKENLYQNSEKPKSHIERMQSEKLELDTKLNGLNIFLSKVGSEESPLLDDNQVYLMEEQSKVMTHYSNLLGERIKNDTEFMNSLSS